MPIDRDGTLVFRMRNGTKAADLSREMLAVSEEIEGDLLETRASEAEMAGRVRVQFLLADADHQVVSEEAALPDEATHAVSETDMALAMTRGEGRQTAERWLAEARVARDTMRFALPPSHLALGAGDIVRLPVGSGGTLARIDKVEVMEHQIIDAVRIEPEVFRPSELPEDTATVRPITPTVPVVPIFLDLPLMTGDEVTHAPHVALTATPWPGAVAIYEAAQDSDYNLNKLIAGQSAIGLTETDLVAARPGKIDLGAALEVRLASGGLQSISEAGLLSGGNLMAIGDGTPGNWELFQFRDAELVSEGRWRLSHRLRGQAGSDGLVPTVWPAGSFVVALDGTPTQIGLKTLQRGLERHYRVGPASLSYDHAAYEHRIHAFDGNGLRPYRPVHLRVADQAGDLAFSWIRRTRIDGDGWDLAEVPLGEDREAYRVQVRQGTTVLRDVTVTAPFWAYGAGDQSADGVAGGFTLAVAQLSERYGPGPFAELEFAQ
ncbi:phage tail protein [Antarctobacter heliothermus]|uniref:Putative phage tail protein n=1 Tax=Antarctobacter heliothermus TaxID=74033 RepID=A0A239M9C6_9RHOB|nr:phage tail protein [Antarctobacter heliothermus]SNT38802.1 Putative phage tail protein [Antarctobacter heliothermus]